MTGARAAGVGVLTGWGEGVAALPVDARRAAAGRRVVAAATPARVGDRFRRASRECLLGMAAAEAAIRDAGLDPGAVRGDGTALVHVTAAAYGPSNRIFVDADGAGGSGPGGALHFPYTAPSALSGEVAIELGVTGPYVIMIGGASATLEALAHAGRLLAQGVCARALVLAVEVFAECEDLYRRGRWLMPGPLVEAAACALLTGGPARPVVRDGGRPSRWEGAVRRRAGETFACEPLIALALARASGVAPGRLTGRWRGRRATLQME